MPHWVVVLLLFIVVTGLMALLWRARRSFGSQKYGEGIADPRGWPSDSGGSPGA